MKASEPKSRPKQPNSRTITGIIIWLKLFGVLGMIALIPTLSAYLLNSYQLSIQEIWFPALLNIFTGLIVSLIFYRLWRRNRLSAFVGGVLTAIMLTSSYDERFAIIQPFLQAILPLPKSADPVYSLIFIGIIFVTSYWIGRLASRFVASRKWEVKTVLRATTIAIGATFLLQLIPAVKDLAVAWPQFFYTPPKLSIAASTAKTAAKPDIYYIVMDRYASPDVLQEQFGFDDTDFDQYLSSNGFSIRPDAHQNYPYTAQSIASTMNANYNKDMIKKFGNSSTQTIIPYNQTIRNSPVAAYLKSIGYQYHLLSNWYETSNLSPLANNAYSLEGLLSVLNHTYIIDNFAKNQLLGSVYWRFLQPGLNLGSYKALVYQNDGGDQMTINQLKNLKNLANGSTGGKFVFAHILVPHDPYFFNADGSLNTNSDGNNFGEPIKQKYIGQVKFINAQMKSVISAIISKSQGKAVIVLQSDEGPYPLDLNQENFDTELVQGELASGNMLNWSNTDLNLKFGNFAAYHIPGATDADLAAGGTNVNAFRLVLNTLFNTNMTYLPDCYYAFPNGRAQPFYYQNIDKQLTGSDNPACAVDGTGPKT